MTKRIVNLDNSILFMLQVENSPVHKGDKVDYVDEEKKIANFKNYPTYVYFLIPQDKNGREYKRITLSIVEIKKILEAAEKVNDEPTFTAYYEDLPF